MEWTSVKHERVFAYIDLDIFKSNVTAVKSRINPNAKLMAVVKANAYGHGAVPCALAALSSGADFLGVASAAEGIELRNAGISAPILVFCEPFPYNYMDFITYELTGTVCSLECARGLSSAALSVGKTADVHIKIDTGMNRVGFKERNISDILKVFKFSGLKITGIYTHFADSFNPDISFTVKQFNAFDEILNLLANHGISGLTRHTSSSGGVVNFREYDLDMVRPGTMLYGILGPEQLSPDWGIRPVMTLAARILQVKEISPGETVGYDRTYSAKASGRIATAAIGYGDGLFRQLSNAGRAIVNGAFAPITGIVCMDTVMLDISAAPDVSLGDYALFIGHDDGVSIKAWDVAKLAGTVSLDVTASVNDRVKRIYGT